MFNFKFIKNYLKEEKPLEIFYVKPSIECSNTILLAGPAYGDKTFFGSFLLDVSLAKFWIKEHADAVFSSSKLEQAARTYLPIWCDNVSSTNDSYVTLIDVQMRHVLVPYTYDFYAKGFLKTYCHQCQSYCDEIVDNSSEAVKDGNLRSWTEEWLCSSGHCLHRKSQQLQLIIRQNKGQ